MSHRGTFLMQFCVAFVLFFGLTSSVKAITIDLIDNDPFINSQYVGTTDLVYTHDFLDNGYNSLTDTITHVELAILLLDDDADEQVLTVMFDFEGTDDEELSVTEGAQVTLIYNAGEWLYIRDETGNEGYIPTTYVDGLGSTPEPSYFQLSFDGDQQNTYFVNGAVYYFDIPVSYLLDGKLNLNIHAAQDDFDFDNAHITMTIKRAAAIPEPATIILCMISLIAGFIKKRFK